MKRAVLYIRVSTDEQADKGYSLAAQEEQLKKYCAHHHIDMLHTFIEDHSAKTFDRPQFKKMHTLCKQSKGKIDLLLFVKWDRFSRNTKESYHMIHEFSRLGIEVRAIEQPLDLSVPESKIMLAIYLASPEVENDRRSMNVFSGMRKAKKEGRYMGTAPPGYRNARDENNNPMIKPNAYAPLIRNAFVELATGNYSQEEVRKRLTKNGLPCSRNSFNKLVRNPVYAGQLFIPPFKDEQGGYVKARHEPIVEESLFYKVQDVINGNRPSNTSKNTAREEFPLRGFLECPKCGRPLTGSSALSKSKRLYFYYHCIKGCKEIQRTDKVHLAFEELLTSITAKNEVLDLYEQILKKLFTRDNADRAQELKVIDAEIARNRTRIDNAMQMMVDGAIEPSEYRAVKARFEEEETHLLRQKMILDLDKVDYSRKVADSFNLLRHLDKFYHQADVSTKQKLVCLNFPEKLIFKNGRVQTPRMNEVLSLITLVDSKLENKKRDNEKNFFHLSPEVRSQGFKPRTF